LLKLLNNSVEKLQDDLKNSVRYDNNDDLVIRINNTLTMRRL